ncbi:MAG: LPS export ABC transporter periplasmic protein LptC [Oleiphilaceae bacterium]|nr:LPS export ABC transporter periplasmic protein LptC [Oleiphilaceae bacterium]
MSRRDRRRLPWLRLVGLALSLPVLAFLLWQTDEARDPLDAQALRGPTEPDSFVVNGRFLSFSEQGRRASMIESPRIEQFESRGLATLVTPEAEIYDRETGIPWRVTARQGEFRENESILELEQDVVIKRPLPNGGEGTMATEVLTLNNAERTAYTEAPVLITDQFSTTRGIGMKAWIDDRIVDLHAEVESYYDPVTRGEAR